MYGVRIICAIGMVVLAGCLGASPSVDSSEVHYVHVYEEGIEDTSVTIESGDTVMWVIHSGNHSLMDNEDRWSSGELSSGDRFEKTFFETGTYEYHCHLHSHESDVGDATIVVQEEG